MADEFFQNSLFLQQLQNWARSYAPTRQFSPNDIFLAMEWANSGVRLHELTDYLDHVIAQNPDFFTQDFKITRLKTDAEKLIASKHQTLAERMQTPVVARDPFAELLACVTQTGQQTKNEFVRQALRQTWKQLKLVQNEAKTKHPDWHTTAAEFYELKAMAITAAHQLTEEACNTCYDVLTDEEKQQVDSLTPAEQIHQLQLGPEASRRYRQACRLQKIAEYFGLNTLLHFFD